MKRTLIVILCSLLLAVAVFVFASNISNRPTNVVGGYNTSNLSGSFLESDNEAYLIGANSEGLPILHNPDLAWEAMLSDYADGLKAIQNSFDLAEITKEDFGFYKAYGMQIDDAYSAETIEQCKDVSRFLDIYENSFAPSRRK